MGTRKEFQHEWSIEFKSSSRPRRGTTLVEVLMAVLLMGIGVVTLMSLFLISVSRSLQATQLTNATILSSNADAMLDVLSSNLVFTPNGGVASDYYDENYVIDPLGWNRIFEMNPSEPAWANTFGNDGTPPVPPPNLPRYAASFENNAAMAAELVALPDSWIVLTEGLQTNFTNIFVDLPASVDLSEVPVFEDTNENGVLDPDDDDPGEDFNGDGDLDTVVSRVVLFDTAGRISVTRDITHVDLALNRILWDEFDPYGPFEPDEAEDRNQNGVYDTHALPPGFTPGLVRVEAKDLRYTWMLTVRNNAGVASVTVVVFANRPFDAASERIYQSNGVPAFSLGSKVVTVDYVGIPKPYLKKGSYVFDAENAYWYQIQRVDDDESAQHVELTVDRPAVAFSNSAILMRGIVDVYPKRLREE